MVGSVTGPTINGTNSSAILTTAPSGPNVLVPAGSTYNGTGGVPSPNTILYDNCSMAVIGTNGTTLWHTNTTSKGPCDLIMGADGTMTTVDKSTGATVWSNAGQFTNTTASCAPYTISMLPTGKLKRCRRTATTTRCGRLLGRCHRVSIQPNAAAASRPLLRVCAPVHCM